MIKSNTTAASHIRINGSRGGACRPVARPRPHGRTAATSHAARTRRKSAAGGRPFASWSDFLRHYERFTDVLCVAAKTGITDRLEAEYAVLRFWFTQHYPHFSSRIRTLLIGAAAPPAEKDPFEAVFSPVSLRDLLAADSGDLICRVTEISDSFYEVAAA